MKTLKVKNIKTIEVNGDLAGPISYHRGGNISLLKKFYRERENTDET